MDRSPSGSRRRPAWRGGTSGARDRRRRRTPLERWASWVREWQAEAHPRGVTGGLPIDPETAAVGIDDRATDRQPHAEPVGLRREERLEQALGHLRGNAASGIGEADGRVPGRDLRRLHADLPAVPAALDDRVDGVLQQIHHHLLDLDPTEVAPERDLAEHELQLAAWRKEGGAQELRRRPDDRAQLAAFDPPLAVVQLASDVRDDATGAMRLRGRLVRQVEQLFRGRTSGPEVGGARLQEVRQRAERLAE